MSDGFDAALWQQADVVLGAADTTHACQQAQRAHSLKGTGAVALGRLLTGVALLRFCTPRVGTLSLQMLTDGPLRQLFADVTDEGKLRGYCKGHGNDVITPGRASVARDVGRGVLSVMRVQTQEEFTRSSTELHSAEIDEDLASYAATSEQVPTIVVCDVLLDDAGHVLRAGGAVAQALPTASADALNMARDNLAHLRWLQEGLTPKQRLAVWHPDAQLIHQQPLAWECRCNIERATRAVGMLSQEQIKEMIEKDEPAEIDCEFCHTCYRIPPEGLHAFIRTADAVPEVTSFAKPDPHEQN